MNIEFNKIDNVNAEITLLVSKSDIDPKVKQELKNVARRHAEPGFRPGHVPAQLIQKKYGDAVRYDVINKTVSEEIYGFVKKENLKVLGNPVPDKETVPDFKADEMVFKFRVGIAPEIDLKLDKDLHIPFYTIKVSDEMASRQDDALRRRFGAQVAGEKIEETAVVKGSVVELNADGSEKEDGIRVEEAILSPEYFKDEDQRKLFVGMNKGASIVFNPAKAYDSSDVELSSFLHVDREKAAEIKSDFRFDVAEIIVLKLAEHNQEFFDEVFGKDQVHNEEEYNEAIRKMIAAQLLQDSNYRFTIDAREALTAAVGEIELPDQILRDYLVQTDEAITEETVEASYANMRPDLVWQLIRDEVAKKLEIKLEESDLMNMAKAVARSQFAQYGMASAPDEMVEKFAADILKERKGREQIANQALDNKLYNGLKATVALDEKEVSVEEFNQLFAPEK